MLRSDRPWARIEALLTNDSGKLDTKIAGSNARPTVPSPSEMPRARFSGTPSNVTAARSASPRAWTRGTVRAPTQRR